MVAFHLCIDYPHNLLRSAQKCIQKITNLPHYSAQLCHCLNSGPFRALSGSRNQDHQYLNCKDSVIRLYRHNRRTVGMRYPPSPSYVFGTECIKTNSFKSNLIQLKKMHLTKPQGYVRCIFLNNGVEKRKIHTLLSQYQSNKSQMKSATDHSILLKIDFSFFVYANSVLLL